MQVCYEYVGFVKWWADLGGEGQAAWLGAIGSLIAVGLTAWFYFKDRRERLRIESRAAAEHQKECAYRAWKLALRIFPVVESSVVQLERIELAFNRDPILGRRPPTTRAQWELVDADRLEKLMGDMADLTKDTQAKLIFHLNLLWIISQSFTRWVVEDDAGFYVDGFRQALPQIREAISSGKAASQALEKEVARNGSAAG